MFKILCEPYGWERRPGWAISDRPKRLGVNTVDRTRPNGEPYRLPVLPDYYNLDAPTPADG